LSVGPWHMQAGKRAESRSSLKGCSPQCFPQPGERCVFLTNAIVVQCWIGSCMKVVLQFSRNAHPSRVNEDRNYEQYL
jgi:hypothetical protein